MLDTVCVQYKSAAAVAPRAPTNNFGGADHGPVEARRPAGGAAGARTCACVHACDLRARAHAPRSRPRAVLHPWPAMCPPPSAPPPRTCIRAPTAYLHSRAHRVPAFAPTACSCSPRPVRVANPNPCFGLAAALRSCGSRRYWTPSGEASCIRTHLSARCSGSTPR